MSDYEHDGNIFTGVEDELREHREYQKNYSGGGGSGGHGCLTELLLYALLMLIAMSWEAIKRS